MAVNSSFKNMVLCLFVICLVCSALLAGVFALTKEPIAAAAVAKTNAAISNVVPDFDGNPVESSIEVGGKEFKYYTVSKDGSPVAYAIMSSSVGFGGPVSLMVGVTSDGVVFNSSVLSQTETPGLGAKCTEPAFADQFKGFNPAEKKLAVKKDGGDIDAITASTITSRAYVEAIKTALNVYEAISAASASDACGTCAGEAADCADEGSCAGDCANCNE